MRGAVPAPKEKPCMPCRSLEAHSANSATAISTTPPTKSCGPRDPSRHDGFAGAVRSAYHSSISLPPNIGPLRAHVLLMRILAYYAPLSSTLPSDFRQTTPAKPKDPSRQQHPERIEPRGESQHRRHEP